METGYIANCIICKIGTISVEQSQVGSYKYSYNNYLYQWLLHILVHEEVFDSDYLSTARKYSYICIRIMECCDHKHRLSQGFSFTFRFYH